ncbi:MAG TPA: Imm26 family immunity protein [Flavisolibacter sp.]|jgi:hypothetical protein|nr:Imm26 family immunity protein [Flavisolibacter sp.]
MKARYDKGYIICLPLINNSYGAGLITRIDKPIILGCFINKRFDNIPEISLVEEFLRNKKNIVLIKKFGSLGLDKGEWKILGKYSNWKEEEWPLSPFIKTDVISNKKYLEYYDDRLKHIKENELEPNDENIYPQDGLAGYKFLEKKLNQLLSRGLQI